MPDLTPHSILVVEDDGAIRDLLDTRLALAGYRVTLARDGVEAIERLVQRPRAVLLDINMPRLDGFGVLTWMGRQGHLRNSAVMLLTARNAHEDVERGLRLGAKDYLAKPFSDAALLSRVARLLRLRQSSARRAVGSELPGPLLL